jgi:hypothetical protein
MAKAGSLALQQILIAVISGGSNETLFKAAYRPNVNLEANKERARNRDAILATFAHNATYFVTHEAVQTTRVVRLDARFERKGRDGLPEKAMAMWQRLHTLASASPTHYDWIMKIDDDTHVHLPRLAKTLSLFRTDLPLVLGRRTGSGPSRTGFCQGAMPGLAEPPRAAPALTPPHARPLPRSPFRCRGVRYCHEPESAPCYGARYGEVLQVQMPWLLGRVVGPIRTRGPSDRTCFLPPYLPAAFPSSGLPAAGTCSTGRMLGSRTASGFTSRWGACQSPAASPSSTLAMTAFWRTARTKTSTACSS